MVFERYHDAYRIIRERLEKSGEMTRESFDEIADKSEDSGGFIEDGLMEAGIPKLRLLSILAEHGGCPFVEFDEDRPVDRDLLRCVDLEKVKTRLWFPISKEEGTVHVMAASPGDACLCEEILKTLKASRIRFSIALPGDIVKTVCHQQDINPGFPPSSGRTALARVRTWLAGHRTALAHYRTVLSRGRTGLSLIRTGLSFISIALVLFRLFGIGYLTVFELVIFVIGLATTVEGLIWYLPVRKSGQKPPDYNVTESTFGTTVLELTCDEGHQDYSRSEPVKGAEKLRSRWNRLSPVTKKRFLAIDRTDLADERTILANYRTLMAHTRTGLAFTRTGNAFLGLGIGLLRHFHTGPWSILDGLLIAMGLIISIEGLHWYLPGWSAGRASFIAVKKTARRRTLWDSIFHPFENKTLSPDDLPPTLNIKDTYTPGILGTTGLALERTIIAERRNIKARLRTVMARSRTGLAFIRTGASLFSVGMGLQVYFGAVNPYWTCFNMALVLFSLVFIADGIYWHVPAEKIRKRFPYCDSELEISIPDYSRPRGQWERIVLDNDYV